MKYIDSHCHLDFSVFDETRESLMKSCESLGVSQFVVPGVKADSWQRLADLAKGFPQWYCAFGLHPYFMQAHSMDDLPLLQRVIESDNPLAVGEIGLDFYHGDEDKKRQTEFLEAQLDMAKQADLPVILHSRKSHDVLAKILRQKQMPNAGVIHAFSGSWQQAKAFLDMGYKLGLGGAVTWERAKKLAAVVKQLPDDGFVLETDSPDMVPSFVQGEVNTPLNIPKIADYVAKIRGQSLEQVSDNAYQNTLAAFPLMPS